MQRGKCWDSMSMEPAFMGAPGSEESASERVESGVAKDLER